jgi:hypothetical protein
MQGIGYAEQGVHGEVYLWGTVVEHELGWRAQFAYPKTLVVGPESLEELESLKILIEYGADLFVAGENGNIPLWTEQCRGFDHVREVAARLAQSRPSEPEWKEFEQELLRMLAPGQWSTLESVSAPDGHGYAYALSIREDEVPGSPIIAVTDEKLLAKLRSVKGQFVYRSNPWNRGLRVYYYEYL